MSGRTLDSWGDLPGEGTALSKALRWVYVGMFKDLQEVSVAGAEGVRSERNQAQAANGDDWCVQSPAPAFLSPTASTCLLNLLYLVRDCGPSPSLG